MISKVDFIWTVGFQGNTAIVNRRQKAGFGAASPEKLLNAGFLRAAFCSALWSSELEGKSDALAQFQAGLKSAHGLDAGIDEIKRMLGVYQIPQGNLRVQLI